MHVVEDVAGEDGDAEDRDEQSEAYTMEENAHNARDQQQEQAKEQVIAQAREVAFGGPGIDCQAERGQGGNQECLAQNIGQAPGQVSIDDWSESQPFQEDKEEEQEKVQPTHIDTRAQDE